MSDAQATPPTPEGTSPQTAANPPAPQAAAPPQPSQVQPPLPPQAPMVQTAPPPPMPMSESDARLWAMLAHLSGIVIAIIGPLVILLVFGKRNEFVRSQSTEALNFQITVFLATIVSALLMFVIVGFVLLPIVAIGALVFYIIAGLKAYDGVDYRYPINIRMVP